VLIGRPIPAKAVRVPSGARRTAAGTPTAAEQLTTSAVASRIASQPTGTQGRITAQAN